MLARMGLPEHLSSAATLVAVNTHRFDPITVLVPVIGELKPLLDASMGGSDVGSHWLAVLTGAVATALGTAVTAGDVISVNALTASLGVLIDVGKDTCGIAAVAAGSAERLSRSTVMDSVTKLLGDSTRRPKYAPRLGAAPRSRRPSCPY